MVVLVVVLALLGQADFYDRVVFAVVVLVGRPSVRPVLDIIRSSRDVSPTCHPDRVL